MSSICFWLGLAMPCRRSARRAFSRALPMAASKLVEPEMAGAAAGAALADPCSAAGSSFGTMSNPELSQVLGSVNDLTRGFAM